MDWMDFNRDGEVDGFETYVGLQMMAGSRQEAIALTGDDVNILVRLVLPQLSVSSCGSVN